jgi:uncharacterized protein YndB with AHSA1/START domain
MKNTGTLAVALQGDREVVMTRIFNAPRALVWDAFTKPELLLRWFGPRSCPLVECDVDLRVGGGFRYIMRGPDGGPMGMRGVWRELDPPKRAVHLETFDDFPGESIVTSDFAERDGKTTLTITVQYESPEHRQGVLASGMEHGAAETFDRLAEMLAGVEV